MKCLEIEEVRKNFGSQKVLDGVSFSFPDHGMYCIVGDSGSGKSTLFEILSGIDTSYTGEVFLYGKSFYDMSEDSKADVRLKYIGFVRQNCNLFELESALDNVAFPLIGLGNKKKTRKRRAVETLEYLGLKEKADQKVNTLSGGEKQRVAIARALVTDPKIILADEPTGALDKKNSVDVYRIFKEISLNKLVIVVTHDVELAREYADVIIRLENGKFKFEQTGEKDIKENHIITFKTSKKEKPSWSFLTWIKHSINIFKAKRIRSFLTISIISISLLLLGISLYVKKDLKNELNSALNVWTGANGISLRSTNENATTFGKIISAEKEEIDKLVSKYDFIKDYGINYLCSYENYFKDGNEFYFDSFGKKETIKTLGVRNINEYLWLEDVSIEKTIYPERPTVMEDEQIVLSLPYANMISMCLSLHIERSYESLGRYLLKKPLEIFLETTNESWGYADRQMFVLVGVFEEDTPTIYHLRHDWNEYVFEDSMGFPSANDDDSSLPWILRKTYYVVPSKNKDDFFMQARKNMLLDRFVFERDSYEYDQSHNDKRKASKSNRFYVYQADKDSLKYEYLNEIALKYGFEYYSFFGESSYVSFSNGMVSGFACPFFLSDSKERVISISESMSRIRKEEMYLTPDLPSNVSAGHYLMDRNSALTISNDFSLLIEGRTPLFSNEICLSEKLYKKFDESKTLYCEGVISNKENGEYVENEYRLGELKVVGLVKGDKETIYVNPTWSIDYFRDELGMSSFSLEPKKAIFYCDNNVSETVIPLLSNKYPSLRFSDTSLQIESSISEVIEYAEIVLKAASIMTITIAGFLYLTNALLLTLENKREAILLFELGVRRSNIVDSFGANVLLSSFLSLLFASISMISAEFSVNKSLQDNFGTSSNYFKFDLFPILIMCLFVFAGTAISIIYLRTWVSKCKFTREQDFR